MSGEKQSPNPKRKVAPVLGAAGLSLSLAGGASAANRRTGSGNADAEHRCEPRNSSA
jgi:hypothetical protein